MKCGLLLEDLELLLYLRYRQEPDCGSWFLAALDIGDGICPATVRAAVSGSGGDPFRDFFSFGRGTRILRKSEPLKLRVFVDRSVVEVFAGGRQYAALRVYPGREDSVGVSLRAQGQEATLKSLDAWQMKNIYGQ